MTRSVTKTPRDKAARVGWMGRRRRGERDEWCQGRRIGRDETGFALLITRRSQVQILPPLPTRHKQKARTNGPGLLFAHAADQQLSGQTGPRTVHRWLVRRRTVHRLGPTQKRRHGVF